MSSALVCYGLIEVCFDLDGQSSVLDFLRQISLHQFPFAFIVLLFGHNQVDLDWLTTLNLAKLLAQRTKRLSLTSSNDQMCLALPRTLTMRCVRCIVF